MHTTTTAILIYIYRARYADANICLHKEQLPTTRLLQYMYYSSFVDTNNHNWLKQERPKVAVCPHKQDYCDTCAKNQVCLKATSRIIH